MANRIVSSEGQRPFNPYRNGNGVAPSVEESISADDEISLPEILEILLKGKWIILTSFLIVLGSVAAYTFVKAPEYEAKSTLIVSNQHEHVCLAMPTER